jgi:glycosyltransferase involved in cell wall biosynthesis
MKKDVLIIAHFCSDFDGKGNNRFNYLAELLSNGDFDVELVTSDFSHEKKKKRMPIVELFDYKITFIHEPEYKSNVSLKRVYSHKIFGKNFKNYILTRKKPDVIYCAVPSIEIAKEAAKYAQTNHIPFLIDIQDLWPEAFGLIIKLSFLHNIIFHSMIEDANFVYSSAKEIIAVSETYAARAKQVNTTCEKPTVVYLGTQLESFDKHAKDNRIYNKPDDEIWLAYVGTLGHSYDLICVFDALEILQTDDIRLKFIVMGDGPLRSKFSKYVENKRIEVEFLGRLDYAKMIGILCSCDIAVNPIKRGAAQSITNKHADYLAAGLPVINTQESKEYRNLVDEYKIGLNCNNNDSIDLANKIKILSLDRELRLNMGKASRKLSEEKFDRTVSYNKIYELINATGVKKNIDS